VVSEQAEGAYTAEGYTTAEVDALTEKAGALMDQLRAVFSEIRLAVAEIVGEEAAGPAPERTALHDAGGPGADPEG
jgi:hypothetical protein